MSAVPITNNTSFISTKNTETVVSLSALESAVILISTNTVLVETPISTVLVTGIIGPKGESSEDLDMYSKRVDTISDNEMYIGEAAVGTPESSLAWRIRKVVITPEGDISETWANGTSLFNKDWSDRLSLTYT